MSNEEVLNDFPPFLPEIADDLRSYLICPDRLPMHQLENVQEFWPRSCNPTRLLNFDITPPTTTLQVQRDYDTGEIIDFKEVPIQNAGENSSNSMAFTRAPCMENNSVCGNPLNLPFWPGSFPQPQISQKEVNDIFSDELLRIAPGVEKGLLFDNDGSSVLGYATRQDAPSKVRIPENKINLADLIKEEEAKLGIWKTEDETVSSANENASAGSSDHPDEEFILPLDEPMPILKLTNMKEKPGIISEYAVLLDCSKPITNFKELIPEMAHQYPFELDTFQKQAIIQLEKHNHVFVAAHTSAGKTVVAEYAIALCEKHMTRSIYTSPIKALSNQKYRDFKQTFKDVGLITGDFQINPTASCLIMTTEILRSMLYCGSEVTRDIEYVIFDEVHYINDKERGHVWEQVLIMLPERVCVVMLSATVPNTVEFADWLGRTHKRKVYVVSTTHRPVPLAHYLYTGTSGSSKNNRFKILDDAGWRPQGYEQSKATISTGGEGGQQSHAKNRGGGGGFRARRGGRAGMLLHARGAHTDGNSRQMKQESTLWYALIDHLKTKDLLPVVAFTFSRVKCDTNAQSLRGLDLTTQSEKYAISRFFEECIRSLKEPDRDIPQIISMRDILKRGIGVHHSGILPIIKEIVEMLFQNRLLKLLFATETFAMGVNMPSRTVVFDSITKHDGHERRRLLPAEYIQMAGRAGRRGKDKKGTVIILCKGELPPANYLQEMMLGRPSLLTSQFRITYGMVLSLLRVESLTVEGMMSRSFREADHQKSMIKMKEKLADVEKTLEGDYSSELSAYLEPLVKFYQKARQFLDARKESIDDIISSAKALKVLTPGRVIIITHVNHINKLAIVLSQSKRTPISFRVLVLIDDGATTDSVCDEKTEFWYKMLGLSRTSIYCPVNDPGHEVITVNAADIFHVCGRKIRAECDFVLKDWDQRQIPRFRADPPGDSCREAVEELLKLSTSVKGESLRDNSLGFMDFNKDMGITESSLYEKIWLLRQLRDDVEQRTANLQIPNFEEQFRLVFKKKILEDERDYLRHMLSDASMALYPDYENRIQLLRHLKYVDGQNRVELKGRVACEIGMNELLITELVLRNILTKMKPAEVAALLSSMVFQAKTQCELSEQELTPELLSGIAEIKEIHQEIRLLEGEYQVHGDDFKDLNFGLVHVVYEWASEKPFAEIMELTDIQEGIIVRCIQQLNELICDVKNAARLIGEPALQSKMEEASTAIKRDIVFAASLYTQRESTVL